MIRHIPALSGPRLSGLLLTGLLLTGLLCVGCGSAPLEPACQRFSAGATCLAPVSAPTPAPAPLLGRWVGAVTHQSAQVRLMGPSGQKSQVRLRLNTVGQPDQPPKMIEGARSPGGPGLPDVFTFTLTGLSPQTDWHFTPEVNGQPVDAFAGHFRTLAPPGQAAPLKLAFASCARSGHNAITYDLIRRFDPDLFLHTGDMHYGNLEATSVAPYAQAWLEALAIPGLSALLGSTALAYVWDDHDYGPNDSDADQPGRAFVRQAYQRLVPHYPLPDAQGPEGPRSPQERAIYQQFSAGRVLFVMTDGRSEKAHGAILGARQRAWLKQTLTTAAADPEVALIIWVNPTPWTGTSAEWADAAEERAGIVAWLTRSGAAHKLIMLSGDAHMSALDDGRHNPHGGFPFAQGGPIDHRTSSKGVEAVWGPYLSNHQFGTLVIDDTGGDEITLTVGLWGYTADPAEMHPSTAAPFPAGTPPGETRVRRLTGQRFTLRRANASGASKGQASWSFVREKGHLTTSEAYDRLSTP